MTIVKKSTINKTKELVISKSEMAKCLIKALFEISQRINKNASSDNIYKYSEAASRLNTILANIKYY